MLFQSEIREEITITHINQREKQKNRVNVKTLHSQKVLGRTCVWEVGVPLTFAVLPCCVPGEAEEGGEENNRSGHSSISEPHLISAMPVLG